MMKALSFKLCEGQLKKFESCKPASFEQLYKATLTDSETAVFPMN